LPDIGEGDTFRPATNEAVANALVDSLSSRRGTFDGPYGLEMNCERVVELLETRPFRPFGIHITSEDAVEIESETFASIHDDCETLIVSPPSVGWTRLIDLKMISSITVHGGSTRSDR